jgi:hypothetical protein
MREKVAQLTGWSPSEDKGAQVVRLCDVRYYPSGWLPHHNQMMEQTKERRKLGLAILISLLLHFLVGFSLAAFGSALTPAPPLEDKPVELTIVDLSATPPPLAPKDPPFMETAPSKESAEKPKEQTFESNANSIAASKLPATGDLPLPSQDGKERPAVNLETHDYSLPTDGSKPQPEPQSTVAPDSKPTPPVMVSPKPKASEAPVRTPTAAPATTPRRRRPRDRNQNWPLQIIRRKKTKRASRAG